MDDAPRDDLPRDDLPRDDLPPGESPCDGAPRGAASLEDTLLAYAAGRADGLAGRRDQRRAADPGTGADYRIGFLDGRLEVFRLHAQLRKIVEDSAD